MEETPVGVKKCRCCGNPKIDGEYFQYKIEYFYVLSCPKCRNELATRDKTPEGAKEMAIAIWNNE